MYQGGRLSLRWGEAAVPLYKRKRQDAAALTGTTDCKSSLKCNARNRPERGLRDGTQGIESRLGRRALSKTQACASVRTVEPPSRDEGTQGGDTFPPKRLKSSRRDGLSVLA